ncbi:MAG TPA: DUF4097 family beta strand repeat-containing protein [Thermoanaerobaculia bacterium]|nr:DUF4097 family beta strand repeat-containing protein [Thermoanaerobaculia bacterium]
MLRLRSLCALLLLIALPVFAEDAEDSRFELKYGKNFNLVSGGRVTIDHGFGDLVIRTHEGNQVQVRANIRSSDDDIGKAIRIIAGESAGGVHVRTEFPEIRGQRHLSYSVDMTVTVPSNAHVQANNEFGSIDARGMRASGSFGNKQGAMRVQDATGNQTVTNSFGAIEIIDVRGTVSVANNNGAITIKRIAGPVTAANRFGAVHVTDVQSATLANTNGAIEAMDIGGSLKAVNAFGQIKASTIAGSADLTTSNARVEVSNVSGSAIVKNSFGSVVARSINGALTIDGNNSQIDAEDVGGNATVDTGFGAVSLRNIRGSAKVTTQNGGLRVSDISGTFTAKTQFGSVQADRVGAAASVESTNGSVTLNEIGAGAKVRASFGPVFVNGVGAGVDIVNTNGAIAVAGLRGQGCQPVTLRTNFSSIKVSVPATASYAVNASTSFGRVHSDLPVTTSGVSDGTLIGTIGRGGCKLELANANGNITIEKD